MNRRIQNYQEKLFNLRRSYAFRKPEDVFYQKMQRVDELQRNLIINFSHIWELKKQNLFRLQQQLHALNPSAILKRGYSICYKDGEIVKDVKQVNVLDMVQVRLAKGQFLSQVQMLGESK